MKQSVVVPTRNRAASLARMLASLADAEPPRATWEIVVVDNGSDDDTQHVIARFRDRLPLRGVLEPRAGVSHARNAGIAAAAGNYLIWTDDDVTVCRSWLRSYESGFEANPRAAFFGGPIRPRFVGEPPSWVLEQLPFVTSAYAGLEVMTPVLPLDALSKQLPFGANMAVRAAEQRQHLFDPGLGRQPWRHGILSGEETSVLKRIAAAGGTGVWLPDAGVDHWIEPDRQTLDYLHRYWVGMGYLAALRGIQNGRIADARAQRRLSRRVAWKRSLYWMARTTGRSDWWMPALRRNAVLRGRLLAHSDAHAARQAPGASVTTT
ncbi:MAG TPA: glycosyltransferase [Myxococcota bacterium]|nr:glycosyltransferase [Myxococcota bacterium]